MRRPFDSNAASRLDSLLEARAKEGVQVCFAIFFLNFYLLIPFKLSANQFCWPICRFMFSYTKRSRGH